MNVLIACEESQTICKEMRKVGNIAYSCDMKECSGGHPEWHIHGDCLPILNGHCSFVTQDGLSHAIDSEWDLIIAHPPCTYLSISGNRWFNVDRYGEQAIERQGERTNAVCFFMKFTDIQCKRVAIENPLSHMSVAWRKPDQIIQPYMFGDPYEKKTCLWLKGLKPLVPTDVVKPAPRIVFKSGRTMASWYASALYLPVEERQQIRSKTFEGIAKAMTYQWTLPFGGTKKLF